MASVELGMDEKEADQSLLAPAPLTPSGKLVLDIDLTDISIEDMQIMDKMGAPESGTFAAAVDVMAKFVTNIDIRKRPLRELRAITKAVMAQIKEESAGN